MFKIECLNCEMTSYPNDPQGADFYSHNCIEVLKRKLKEANDEIVVLSMGFGRQGAAPQQNRGRVAAQQNRNEEVFLGDQEAVAPRRNVADAAIPLARCREGCQMQLVSGTPAEYEDVGVPRCDECKQTSLNEYENFYHCTTHGFDLCKVCALVQVNAIQRDQEGKYPVRGHDCPLTYEPNGQRHMQGQMCDGGEMMAALGVLVNGHPSLGNCLSSASHNILNQNQQYFYCAACDVDVCVCCAVKLQQ